MAWVAFENQTTDRKWGFITAFPMSFGPCISTLAQWKPATFFRLLLGNPRAEQLDHHFSPWAIRKYSSHFCCSKTQKSFEKSLDMRLEKSLNLQLPCSFLGAKRRVFNSTPVLFFLGGSGF